MMASPGPPLEGATQENEQHAAMLVARVVETAVETAADGIELMLGNEEPEHSRESSMVKATASRSTLFKVRGNTVSEELLVNLERPLPYQVVKKEHSYQVSSPSTDAEHSEREPLVSLEQASWFIRQHYSQEVFCLQLSDRLKVMPRRPDTRLVDEPSVRLNLLYREGQLTCESYSHSRHLITRRVLTNLEKDLGGMIEEVCGERFSYCPGLEWSGSSEQLVEPADLQQLLLHSYNGQLLLRSRTCTLLLDRKQESWESSVSVDGERCVDCRRLERMLHERASNKRKRGKPQKIPRRRKPKPISLVVEPLDLQLPSPEDLLEVFLKTESPEGREQEEEAAEDQQQISTGDVHIHQPPPTRPTRKRSPKKKLKQSQESQGEKSLLTCPECEKPCRTRQDLKIHRRKHTGEKPYGCSECGKHFPRREALYIHNNSLHNQLKSFLCTDCGTSFRSCSSLIDHRKRVHQGVRPHRCEECGKEFFSRKDYVEHRRVHSGEKPFQCPLCGKCFTRSFHMKRHAERIHKTDKILSALGEDEGGVMVLADVPVVSKFQGPALTLQIDSTAQPKKTSRRPKVAKNTKSERTVPDEIQNASKSWVSSSPAQLQPSPADQLNHTRRVERRYLPLDLAQRSCVGKARSLLVQRHETLVQRLQQKPINSDSQPFLTSSHPAIKSHFTGENTASKIDVAQHHMVNHKLGEQQATDNHQDGLLRHHHQAIRTPPKDLGLSRAGEESEEWFLAMAAPDEDGNTG